MQEDQRQQPALTRASQADRLGSVAQLERAEYQEVHFPQGDRSKHPGDRGSAARYRGVTVRDRTVTGLEHGPGSRPHRVAVDQEKRS